MFGQAPVHGRKTFQNDPPNTLRVHNAFYTLQGEGPLSGQPSVFLRLSHCNLQCAFCDTDYEQSNLMTFPEIELYLQRQILGFFKGDLPPWARWTDSHSRQINLVITGGEPLIQRNVFRFVAWLQNRRSTGVSVYDEPEYKAVQFETNGTQPWPSESEYEDESEHNVVLIVSPKCNERTGAYLHPHASYRNSERVDAYKFVVNADPASPYHTVPDWDFDGSVVYVSPMNIYLREPQAKLLAAKQGTLNDLATRTALERISFWEPGLLDMEANRRNHEHAAELCMRHGYRLSLQTHLLASLP